MAGYGWLWKHESRKVEGCMSDSQAQGVLVVNPTVFDYRMMRGQAIAQVESNVRRIDQHEYRVKSQSGVGEYQVIQTEAGWDCSCPDFRFRGVKCKHAFAVELSLQIRRRIENARRVVPLDYQSCLSCGSQSIFRDGILHNKSGDIQRFSCKACGKRFAKNLGFERMKASPEAITQAMQLYFSGVSLRGTQRALALQGVRVSHVAVLKWIRKYVAVMDEYLSKFDPQVSDTWRADELWVKVKGNMKYLFSVMDDETRFWIAQEVADSKEKHDASRLFHQAWFNAGKAPATMITDGLRSYSRAYKKELGWRRHDVKQTHVREIALAGQVYNNKMERMNGEVRDREKVMRGIKRTDTPILKGIQIYHNFIRPHEGLNGATPADRAGIKIEGDNKWLTIIQNAKHQANSEGQTNDE
jgi:putative transposase